MKSEEGCRNRLQNNWVRYPSEMGGELQRIAQEKKPVRRKLDKIKIFSVASL